MVLFLDAANKNPETKPASWCQNISLGKIKQQTFLPKFILDTSVCWKNARNLSRKNKAEAAVCLLLVYDILPWLLNHLPDLHKKVFACMFCTFLVKKEQLEFPGVPQGSDPAGQWWRSGTPWTFPKAFTEVRKSHGVICIQQISGRNICHW